MYPQPQDLDSFSSTSNFHHNNSPNSIETNLSVDSTPCTFKFNTLNELSQIGPKPKNTTQRGARDFRRRKVKRKREIEDPDEFDFFLYDTDEEEEEELAWTL